MQGLSEEKSSVICEKVFENRPQFPRSVIRIEKNYQTSDYNPALIPYFGYLKMEKSKFFNTGFFSNCDFKVSTLYSKANNEK